jgi:hypothetical protein
MKAAPKSCFSISAAMIRAIAITGNDSGWSKRAIRSLLKLISVFAARHKSAPLETRSAFFWHRQGSRTLSSGKAPSVAAGFKNKRQELSADAQANCEVQEQGTMKALQRLNRSCTFND